MMTKPACASLLMLIASFAAVACRGPGADAVPVVEGLPVATEVVAEGLDTPWALDFAPDGRIFISERPGRIRVVRDGILDAEPWATLDVVQTGETGLMGLAISPDFIADQFVYVAMTVRDGNGNLINRVVRIPEANGRGGEPETILDAIPSSRFHAGTAVAFGADGMLYVSTGDAQSPGRSDDLNSLAGKILRLTPEGGVPEDNPTYESMIFAYGFRNVQGMTWTTAGEMFATDHGPSGFPSERFRRHNDELNNVLPTSHYGWPTVAGRASDSRFVDPLTVWTPAIAPAGVALYTGPYQPWRRSVLVGALRGQQLRRVELERMDDDSFRAVEEQVLLEGEVGRIRAVAMGPDGHLYITTSNRDGRGNPAAGDDRLLRVLPGGR